MKIALIGADGQLGADLAKNLRGKEFFPLYFPDFDITKHEEAEKTLSKINPDVIINTAAYNRVDECEENAVEAFALNSISVKELVLLCCRLDSVLVHFSSDYVFDGRKTVPYTEEDVPAPLNVYGISKLAGEFFIRNTMEKYYLIRTCGLYGEAGCWGKGSNFVDKIISLEKDGLPLKVVNDQCVTPTSTAELALRVIELIQTKHYGLFHLTNEDQCTWHEFAETIFNFLKKNPLLVPIDSKTLGAKALRPSYSVLENKNAKKIGLTDFSHWKDALMDYMVRKEYI